VVSSLKLLTLHGISLVKYVNYNIYIINLIFYITLIFKAKHAKRTHLFEEQ